MSNELKISEVAKQLGVGSKTLFKQLREQGAIDQQNIASREMINKKLMVLRERSYKTGYGAAQQEHNYWITLVTEDGVDWVAEQLNKDNNNDAGALRH